MPNELKVVIDADVNGAIAGVNKFARSVDGLTTGSIAQLRKASLLLKTQLENLSPKSLNSSFGKQLTTTLQVVNAELKSLEAQSIATGAATSNVFSKAYSGVRTLANIIPGIGIGGLIGLAAGAINDLTQGFFDATFGATKLHKAIDDSVGSVTKESSGIITMVKALQSGTLSSSEFKKVKAELIAQAPEFQKTFDGDKISIEASDKALVKYIERLTTTVRVTAALAVVNETISKSIATIAKGGESSSIGTKISEGLTQLGGLGLKASKVTEQNAKRLQEAFDVFKPDNISKLIDDTFKKLGISFKDFTGTIDDKELKKQLEKIKADFEKFQTETISKAKQFNKEFGNAFVLPDLEESFFVSKADVFKKALKELSDVKKELSGQSVFKIKIPIETDFQLLPDPTPLTKEQLDELTAGFIKSAQLEHGINIDLPVKVDLTIPNKIQIDELDKLLKGFGSLGTIGFKAFEHLDFTNFNAGLAEGNRILSQMLALANTLTQSIAGGLANAFNSVFDAILQGKSVFKALGQAVQALVVDTIKAVVQMLILRAITNALFPGAAVNKSGTGGIGRLIGGAVGHQANLGFGTVGSTPFQNVLTINVNGQISGDVIRLAGQRAANSANRFG